MMIIGCDFHTRFQQIAMMDTTTGELVERRLEHATGEAERFYMRSASALAVGYRGCDPLCAEDTARAGDHTPRFAPDSILPKERILSCPCHFSAG